MASSATISRHTFARNFQTTPHQQSAFRDPRFTPIELRRRFGAQRIVQLSSPLDGYLLWLSGRENPELPIMILASFFASMPQEFGLLPWINDSKVVEHLHIPLRGFTEFIYGEFVQYGLYGEYFRPCQPKDAKHLLLRVRWSSSSKACRRYKKPNSARHKVKYFAKTAPDCHNIGYDFIVVPVLHQSDYDPAKHAEHVSFVREATNRHQRQWNAKTQPSQTKKSYFQTRRLAQLVQPPRRPSRTARPTRPAPLAQPPQDNQTPLTDRMDELRKRAWSLYCDGYKELKLRIQDQSFSFLGRGYACTDRALRSVDRMLSQYEEDAVQRASTYRELLGLKTQFAIKGHKLQLDVWTELSNRQVLALQLDDQIYTYSEHDLGKLREALRTID